MSVGVGTRLGSLEITGFIGRGGMGEVYRVQSLKSGQRYPLISGGSDARYVPSGHIVYVLGSTLLAVPFDQKTLQVTGGPVPVVEKVMRSLSGATGTSAGGRGLTGATQFTFSSKGIMIYIPEADADRTRSVVLVDHSGVRTPLNLPPAQYNHPRISPDGQQLVLQTDDGSNSNIRIYDLNGASPMRRLTFAGQNSFPIWDQRWDEPSCFHPIVKVSTLSTGNPPTTVVRRND